VASDASYIWPWMIEMSVQLDKVTIPHVISSFMYALLVPFLVTMPLASQGYSKNYQTYITPVDPLEIDISRGNIDTSQEVLWPI